MPVSVKCSRCKDSIRITDEDETLIVDGTGGFLCELCVDLEKDLARMLANIIVKHVVARMARKIKQEEENDVRNDTR